MVRRRQAQSADNQEGQGANRIRGPQSALTDFLAANNISAAQIRQDSERRRRELEAAAPQTAESSAAAAARANQVEQDVADAEEAAAEAVLRTKKRKRNEKETIEGIKKAKAKSKATKKKKSGPDDDDDDDWDEALDMYAKSKPMPGQFENCEICNKRFTVTAYSKEGPDGGLLCTPCGKSLAKDAKDAQKAAQPKKIGRKRRQVESNRLDGIAPNKAKSLQQLCIEKLVEEHEVLSTLGDLQPQLLERLAQIFAKKRVLTSKTLKLFMRPTVNTISIHDAAYLEVADYLQMFGTTSNVTKIVIRNACQLKDEAMAYMLDKCTDVRHLQLYAANLVSDDMWRQVFSMYGDNLDAVKLQWLDATFGDDMVEWLVQHCPNLKRLKLKLCRRIGQVAVQSIAQLNNLEHLSLRITNPVDDADLQALVIQAGKNLNTLSLEGFRDLDNPTLAAIKSTCSRLHKLRITENDLIEDSAFTDLFTGWSNPPLHHIDFNSTRDIDNNNAMGPDDAVGFATNGFKAMMEHSGQGVKTLDIASCRHISLIAFGEVFDGKTIYPSLEVINLSFCSCINTRIVAGIFKSCPALRKVIAFGCFDILDVVVPRGVVLIGVPRAQDAIEQIGAGVDVQEAINKMIAIAA